MKNEDINIKKGRKNRIKQKMVLEYIICNMFGSLCLFCRTYNKRLLWFI